MNNMPSMLPIRNWYPSRLHTSKQDVWCEWMQLKGIPFTDPFFEETLAKGRSKIFNSSRFRPASAVDLLAAWGTALPHIPPTAFIFHVSRCGSTLLSQLLGLHPLCISLAEVPFFDDIIRLPFKTDTPSSFSVSETLSAAIRLYGQQRIGNEQHLIIKLDSWHMFFWRQLRALYPEVPFILLYRRPDEVVRSHRKLRGMHAVPGLIEPVVFGFDPREIHAADLDGYSARVLERYFSTYLDVASSDSRAVLLNYEEGPLGLLHNVASSCGMALNETYLTEAAKRSAFHAKHPDMVFSETREHLDAEPYLDPAFELYDQLEHLRLRANVEQTKRSPD